MFEQVTWKRKFLLTKQVQTQLSQISLSDFKLLLYIYVMQIACMF